MPLHIEFLTPDVGHQHLPYDPDGSRTGGGRDAIKSGMMFYLGAHSEYEATLKDVLLGHQVIVIKYRTLSKGVHPQNGQEITQEYDTTEVLEIDNGKVSVIRKYSE